VPTLAAVSIAAVLVGCGSSAAVAPSQSSSRSVDRCGAPSNPDGYNFCGGTTLYNPASDICNYFSCIPSFWNGVGYVVQCRDGMLSQSGGRQGACSHHGGEAQALYAPNSSQTSQVSTGAEPTTPGSSAGGGTTGAGSGAVTPGPYGGMEYKGGDFNSVDGLERCYSDATIVNCIAAPSGKEVQLDVGASAVFQGIHGAWTEMGVRLQEGMSFTTPSQAITCGSSSRGITCTDSTTGNSFTIGDYQVETVNRGVTQTY